MNINPDKLNSIADKLRYYRHKKCLLQREVAAYAGIDRITYASYEDSERDYYPLDKLTKISEMLNVDITNLMDEYTAFLSYGQSQQIRTLRKNKELTQQEFAKRLGVQTTIIKKWENEQTRISKNSWKKLCVIFNAKTNSVVNW